MVSYDMKLIYIYYNSLIYAIGKFPRTLFTFLILLAIHIGTVYIISNFSIGIFVFFLGTAIIYAISSFIAIFNVNECIREYVNSDKNK